MAKREFQCVHCGLIVTGRVSSDGTIRPDNGPPDGQPQGTCVCDMCQQKTDRFHAKGSGRLRGMK